MFHECLQESIELESGYIYKQMFDSHTSSDALENLS